MAIWAIGDVQGCYQSLCELLEQISFDPAIDRLWFTGDLVNRGPDSGGVLRFVRDLGDRAITVLGNHDLHLLAVASGHAELKDKDTLADVLDSPDREELFDWLRWRPLLHDDPALGYTMIHAGLLPQWTIALATELAREVEQLLRADNYQEFFPHMYGDTPDRWQASLGGWDRLRLITNAFTRLRYCNAGGKPDFRHNGPPPLAQGDLMPWFQVPGRKSAQSRVVFGHWSTLGITHSDNILCLDSGCLWGGRLTAARLDLEGAPTTSVNCKPQQSVR